MRSLDSEEKSGMNHPVTQGHVTVEEVTKAAVGWRDKVFLKFDFFVK